MWTTWYNQLAQPTAIVLGGGWNVMEVAFGYWDVDGGPAGSYGRLWEIKTIKDPGGAFTTLRKVQHIWDAGGNLTQRVNVAEANETENFTYDSLDRLLSVSGGYTESYAYDRIGNITCKAAVAAPCSPTNYTYTSGKPHAVSNAAGTAYTYDANGNAITRGAQSLTWDAENRLTGVTGVASFVYDGDGKRVKKIENNQNIVYVNKYYEKNLTTATETTYYYIGDRLAFMRKGAAIPADVRFVSLDHLGSTSLTPNDTGNQVMASIKYMPFGATRSATGPLETEIKFTGQRLDAGVDLYYYGATQPSALFRPRRLSPPTPCGWMPPDCGIMERCM